jgi:tRNA A-37 threonylcarbamoyl transferase component Bud32
MKVPLKIAVIQTTQSFNITGWQTSELYDIYTPEITVYAEKIRQVDRKLSREEIDELIQLIAKAHFLDLWPQNIVVAKEGVYFIDTEFKSFDGSIQWEKMVRFQSLIKEEDRGYFNEKVEAQEKEYKIKEIYSFKSLKAILRKRKLESYPGEMKKFEEDVLNLKYVGAEKAGNDWISPNRFTFHLNEILS